MGEIWGAHQVGLDQTKAGMHEEREVVRWERQVQEVIVNSQGCQLLQ